MIKIKIYDSPLDQGKIWSAKCIHDTNHNQELGGMATASRHNEKWDM